MYIILDTDIDTDCDDAGALAVLHALHSRGQATILGVVCSIPFSCCASTVRAINVEYGRTEIPVGLVRIPDWAENPRYATYRKHREQVQTALYNEIIAARLDAAGHSRPFPDAVSLYRELLADAPDNGVTICAIGTLSALAQLLDSTPDSHSRLSGIELVSKKVRLLVSMAIAEFPSGKDMFNWRMDLHAAAKVISEWPTELVVSSPGKEILTGERLMSSIPVSHPVNLAYRTFLKDTKANRPSWDQVAVLYGALGESEMLTARHELGLTFDAATGAHQWLVGGGGLRGYVQLARAPQEVARHIEDLMIGGERV